MSGLNWIKRIIIQFLIRRFFYFDKLISSIIYKWNNSTNSSLFLLLTSQLFHFLYRICSYMLVFFPVLLISSPTNTSIFTRIHNFPHTQGSTHHVTCEPPGLFQWSRSRMQLHTHARPRNHSFSLGNLALDERTASETLTWSWGRKRTARRLNRPTVREVTGAVAQSGPVLENSLILHRPLCSVQCQWAEKFHPHVTTHCAF